MNYNTFNARKSNYITVYGCVGCRAAEVASLQNAEAGLLQTTNAIPKLWAALALSGADQTARWRQVKA